MITVVLLLLAMYVLLCAVGWCVLAPVDAETRGRLLSAAPIFGAALIGAISMTATRWLTIPQTSAFVAIAMVVCVWVGVMRGTLSWRVSRGAAQCLLMCPALSVPGLLVAGLPSIWVNDSRPVDASTIVDQYYFAANSTYLTEHAMLPGPYWNPNDWAHSANPGLGPVVDVIVNKLRYGQASVASMLSWVLHREPMDTVTAVSLLWLLLIGSAAFVATSLMGVRRRWAMASVPLVTTAFYVTTQSLEGKNDGLLGVSVALMALALSAACLRRDSYSWPLVLAVAGLAAVYSELVLVLVAPVALLAIVGPRHELLRRVNGLAGCWAAGAVLAPVSWIWLAESARIGGRFSQGDTPFEQRRGFALLRAVMGTDIPHHHPAANAVMTVIAVIALVGVLSGLVGAVWLTPWRGAAIGLVTALGWLEVSAARANAGNLQYRTAQLGYALLLVLAVVGWDALLRRRWITARRPARLVASATVVGVVASFSLANAATAASYLPRHRAIVQHIPPRDLDQAVAWVREVGPDNVSVVVPRFTDLIWVALALRNDRGVNFPVIPAIYLGSFPHWDRNPHRYELVGVGATLAGDVTVLHRNDRYQLVRLGPSGMILSPFEPTYYWGRTTYMRGSPCMREGSQMLLLRGSSAPGTFSIATIARSPVHANLVLDVDRREVATVGRPQEVGRWNVQTFQAPRFDSAIINLHPSLEVGGTGTTAMPLQFGGHDLASRLQKADPSLSAFCSADDLAAQYLDGYGLNVSLLQSN